MWLLLLVFYANIILPEKVYIMNKYDTLEECEFYKGEIEVLYPSNDKYTYTCQFVLPNA